jgi:alpha-glucosidase
MTLAAGPDVATLLAEPHHDGSESYVLERPDEPGGDAVVRVLVPRGAADSVALRYVHEGEARVVSAVRDSGDWWRATFPVGTAAVRYRWLLAGGDFGYAWLTGCGVVAHEVADADDFVLSLDRGGPDWHLRSVVYQIFPDRFATSGRVAEAPEWAVRRGWDELPTGRGRATPVEWFGGDLWGAADRLDHVASLGANVLYTTPIFPAATTHRYDASSFERIDPLLGGDEAFDALVAAAHERGIRVVGDLTLNHCGVGHDWFTRAREDPSAAEREFFWFDDALPHGYASWLGVRVLPKLNWKSAELRRRMLDVVAHWLERGLDGWRIDVANMAGRYGDVDLNHEIARAVRDAAGGALVVAEHFHDFRPDLQPGGWHGTMNYSGFMRPAWTWLRADEPAGVLSQWYLNYPIAVPRLSGAQAVAAMRAFRAGVPWEALLHSWTLLDSHDTARFRTVSGSRERHAVGIGLQMTTPGVPMLFAGDELGLEGEWGEDARRTMPWSRRESWDDGFLEACRSLIALRRSSVALARGGLRYAFVGADTIAYLRETTGERLLCLAARNDHEPVRLPLHALGCTDLEPLYGGDASITNGSAVLPGDGPAFHVWRLIDG